jgi:hypothetical protein
MVGVTAAQMIVDSRSGGTTRPLIMVKITRSVGLRQRLAKGNNQSADALFAAGDRGVCGAFSRFPAVVPFILPAVPSWSNARDVAFARRFPQRHAPGGRVVNLAVFFAWRVFWPESTTAAPFTGHFDAFAQRCIAARGGGALLEARGGDTVDRRGARGPRPLTMGLQAACRSRLPAALLTDEWLDGHPATALHMS